MKSIPIKKEDSSSTWQVFMFPYQDVRLREGDQFRAARKLNNPRLLNIRLHTFRHWFGTMLYHKTKDILYVKEKLGHRNINTTLIYIQLAEAIFKEQNDSYHSKVVKTIEEAMRLYEEGWEEWSEFQDVKIYRKRK